MLSVALHSLFALALWELSSPGSHSADDRPLAEIPVVVVPVEEFSVSLPEPSSPASPAPPPYDPPADPAPEPVSVGPLALNSAAATPADEEAPRVAARTAPNVAGPNPPTGGQSSDEASPALFGVPVQARTVVFLIDRSISMGLNGGLDAAKQELREWLERMPATTHFQVLFYNRIVEAAPIAGRDGLLENTEETREAVMRMADRIRAEGGTDHGVALRRALALRCDAILFVTDADDLKPEQVRAITELNRGRVAIHAVQWGPAPEVNEPLQALARLNRGSHRRLGSAYHSRSR
jgi:hypothetical protein